jgi:endonuclease III
MEEGRTQRPFDIDRAVDRVRDAVEPFPKAAMFELAERGHDTPFEQLVACLISVRTYDEVSLPAALRLFAVARTPVAVAKLSVAEIDLLIQPATFHDRKAVQIRDIARRVAGEFGGTLPCDAEVMQSFNGVGPKCANLALGISCDAPVISVDVHVHRVTNRWGYVATKTPEQTMAALGAVLPQRYRVEINKLLVPFGKHVCTGARPRCSSCPVLDMCRRVGVTSHR